MLFMSKSTQRIPEAGGSSAKHISAPKADAATTLEIRIEIDIRTPFLTAVADIKRDWKSWFWQHEETHTVPGMKPVPAKGTDLRRHLPFIEKEGPIHRPPNAVPIFEAEGHCALVPESISVVTAERLR